MPDCALIELDGSLNDQLATPNKLMECLAADRPALSTDFPEARRWMGAAGNTWVLDHVAELAPALARITKAHSEAFQRSHQSIPTWAEQVRPLVHEYQALLDPPSGSSDRHPTTFDSH